MFERRVKIGELGEGWLKSLRLIGMERAIVRRS